MTSIGVSEGAFDIAAIRLGAAQYLWRAASHITQRLGRFRCSEASALPTIDLTALREGGVPDKRLRARSRCLHRDRLLSSNWPWNPA
jgi:hypothetical protein